MNHGVGGSRLRSDPDLRSSKRQTERRFSSARQVLEDTVNRANRGSRGSVNIGEQAVCSMSENPTADRPRATMRGSISSRGQNLRAEDMINSQRRTSVTEASIDVTRIPTDLGSASSVVREVGELKGILEIRTQTIEALSQAMSAAFDTVNADEILARANSESKAAAPNQVPPNISASEIQTIAAERNALRSQVRSASTEIRKIRTKLVDVAGCGDPVSLMRNCQRDMERAAQLRASIEREITSLQNYVMSATAEMEESQRLIKAHEARVVTSEEQLAERAETIVELKRKVEQLETQTEQIRRDSEVTLETALRDKHDRLSAQHADDKATALNTAREQHINETRAALEALRADLLADAERRLAEQLSEQQHLLQASHQQQLAAELDALQRELSARESSNLESQRKELVGQHEHAVGALKQRIKAIEARSASDIAGLKERATHELETALAEQKKSMLADAKHDKTAALTQLEVSLTNKYNADLQNLRNSLSERHRKELANSIKQAEDHLRKKLNHEHTRDKDNALKIQMKSLTEKHREELEAMRSNLQRRSASDNERDTSKKLEALAGKLNREHSQEIAQLTKRLNDEFKVDKANTLKQLKSRIEKQHRADLEEITATNKKLSEELKNAKVEKTSSMAQMQAALRSEKTQAVDSVRERLSKKYEQELKSLREKHSQLVQECAQLRQEKAVTVERLQSNFRQEKTMALQTINKRQKEAVSSEISELKTQIAKLTTDNAELKRDKVQAVERLNTAHRVEKTQELDYLRSRLIEQYGTEIEELKQQKVKLSNTVAELKQEKAQSVERIIAQHRVDKTKEVEGLRQRMEAQYSTRINDLRDEISTLTDINRKLNSEAHVASSDNRMQQDRNKQALQGLRDRLRQLLSSMKLALVPRVNAPLDTSAATPSRAMGSLQVLITGLSQQVPDVSALSDIGPTREAMVAPHVSYDVLLHCAQELCNYLNSAHEELANVHNALLSDRKVIRKQVEAEFQEEFDHKVQDIKSQFERQVDTAVANKAATLTHAHARQLDHQKSALQDELRTYKMKLATQKRQFEIDLQSSLSRSHNEDEDARAIEEENLAMLEAMVDEADELRRVLATVQSDKDMLERENSGLRDALDEARGQSNSSFSTSPSVTPQGSRISLQFKLSELERIRLEKRVANLQAALDQVLGE